MPTGQFDISEVDHVHIGPGNVFKGFQPPPLPPLVPITDSNVAYPVVILSDETIDRIAERVVALLGEQYANEDGE